MPFEGKGLPDPQHDTPLAAHRYYSATGDASMGECSAVTAGAALEVIELEVIDVSFDNDEVAAGILTLSEPEVKIPVPKAVVPFEEAVALTSSSEVEVISSVLLATGAWLCDVWSSGSHSFSRRWI